MSSTITGGNYDDVIVGIHNPNHPANQTESETQSELERANDYILRQASELRTVKAWIAEMEKMEASGKFRFEGLTTEDERKYISLRERTRYKIKSLGHGID